MLVVVSYAANFQALAVAVRQNVPVILWGSPGVGKTSVISDLASRLGFDLETIIASIHDPTDFLGLPHLVGDTMVFAPMGWVKRVLANYSGGRDTIILLDEYSTAIPSVQAAGLRPLLEKVVGEVRLPDSSRWIAAANPPQLSAGGWDLTPPTANRFVHLNWAADVEVVATGFEAGWESARIPVPVFPAQAMGSYERHALTLVASFLRAQPNFLDVPPRDFGSDMKGSFSAYSNAYPTPRSWEFAARLYAGWKAGVVVETNSRLGADVLDVLLCGVVGEAAATSFLAYIKTLSLPDPKKLLSGEIDFVLPDRPDILHAMLSGLEYTFKLTPNDVGRWTRYGDILAEVTGSRYADVAFRYVSSWYHELKPAGGVVTDQHMRGLRPLLSVLERG